jgi:predicted transcriptional regulator
MPLAIMIYRRNLDHESATSASKPVEPGRYGRLGTEEIPVADESIKLIDLISSIRKIEEYLITKNVEEPIQNGWPFSAGSSSFYFWLKETYRRRCLRSNYFNPEYFSGESAWNMLLDLAASRIEGKRISVTSACQASEVPQTTALRWISLLEEDGMVTRENDLSDRRRTFLHITDKAMDLISTYYNKIHSYEKIRRNNNK